MRINRWPLALLVATMTICTAGVSCDNIEDDPGQGGNTEKPDNGKEDEPDKPVVVDNGKKIDETYGIYLGANGAAFGTEGRICVYTKDKDKLVDYVDFADMASVELREDGQLIPKEQMTTSSKFNTMMDAIGPDGASNRRIVHCTPVRIVEDSLLFKPHYHKLDYDKEYYITVDPTVVSGVDFKGVEKGSLEFKTCKKPETKNEITVAKTGKADFRTVQGAIDYAAGISQSQTRTIVISEGIYNEMLYIRNNNNITLKAESGANVEIAYANCEKWVNGTGGNVGSAPSYGATITKVGGRPVILIEGCDMVTFECLTLRNTFGSTAGQAEVIYNNDNSGNCRLIIKSCELWSYQDTFLTKGYAWVYKTLIAGHCDYIWGYPKTCLFEDCEILSRAKGYIVQCRSTSASDKGFVFLNCKLTSENGVADGAMTLARSGGQDTAFDNVTYANCKMGPVISKYGWHTSPAPNPSKPTATSGWKEYGTKDSKGNAADLSSRASYGKVLSAEEAEPYLTRAAVFDGAPFSDSSWLK